MARYVLLWSAGPARIEPPCVYMRVSGVAPVERRDTRHVQRTSHRRVRARPQPLAQHCNTVNLNSERDEDGDRRHRALVNVYLVAGVYCCVC